MLGPLQGLYKPVTLKLSHKFHNFTIHVCLLQRVTEEKPNTEKAWDPDSKAEKRRVHNEKQRNKEMRTNSG